MREAFQQAFFLWETGGIDGSGVSDGDLHCDDVDGAEDALILHAWLINMKGHEVILLCPGE